MAELITGYGIDLEEIKDSADELFTQYLTFNIAGKKFAVSILDVNEIIEISDMTEVPMMPDFIRGVINLRGEVVTVIDLAARMAKGYSEIGKRSCIVLVEITQPAGGKQVIGMLVDAVNEIVEIEQSNIQPAPSMGEGVNTDFIQALGRVDDLFFILLDINHVLSREQVQLLEQMENAYEPSNRVDKQAVETE